MNGMRDHHRGRQRHEEHRRQSARDDDCRDGTQIPVRVYVYSVCVCVCIHYIYIVYCKKCIHDILKR